MGGERVKKKGQGKVGVEKGGASCFCSQNVRNFIFKIVNAEPIKKKRTKNNTCKEKKTLTENVEVNWKKSV